jgi:hypothetical protein
MLKPVHEMTNKPTVPNIRVFGQSASGETVEKNAGPWRKMPEGQFVKYDFGAEGGDVIRSGIR